MKIGLIQPNLDDKHKSQRQAYGSDKRPPETGLAVLSGWINEYACTPHEITVLNPNKTTEYLVKEASEFDVLGITDWFSNHDNCTEIARKVKYQNPEIKIIFGGPNASMMPQLILNNHQYVDFIVTRDGEDALLGIIEGLDTEKIPNLWFRKNNEPMFTHLSYSDLRKMPIWNFKNYENVEERLKEYLEAQKESADPWLISPLTLFSLRGCTKAIKEGVCSYCTSAEEKIRVLPPEKLWNQITHLKQLYDAEIFYMADDIFPVTSKRVKQIADAKPDGIRARIRAYGFLPHMIELSQLELEDMSRNLQKIGIFNLFFGSEHYDLTILEEMNKRGVSVEETARVIKTIYDMGGIKTTIAYLLGLPKESRETLKTNLHSLKHLLEVDDCIERLYISIGMPLKGTKWYCDLEKHHDISMEYQKRMGKVLHKDDSPDYNLLCELSIKYFTSTSIREINNYLNMMIESASQKMPEYRIGGFLLDINE